MPLRLRHIGDRSTTGRFIAAQIEAFDWGEKLDVVSRGVETFDAWKQEILRANGEADVVLFSLYHTVRRQAEESEVVPPQALWHQGARYF
jgi:hypothetical protein